MTEFLTYDLKVSVLIAACYIFYRLLLERDTLHRVSRVVLLVSIALSLVLPLCVVTLHQTVWIESVPLVADALSDKTQLAGEVSVDAPLGLKALPAILLSCVVVAGMVVRLLFVARSYWRLRRLIAQGDCLLCDDGIRLCIVDLPIAPFSWWNTIVVSRQDYNERNPLLMIHERSHIRLRHSIDVVFVELLTALQWFNPVVWLLSRDLRTVHEYEADEAVLSQGVSMAQYISLLTCKATGMQACVLANGINASELKKRIYMMIKTKSPRCSWLKALYIIPVATLSLVATAKTVTDYRTSPVASSPIAVPSPADQPTATVNAPLLQAEVTLPEFPGGQEAMLKFLMENVRYPAAAIEAGIQGRVIVYFVVKADGSITQVQATKVTQSDGRTEITVVATTPDMTDEERTKVSNRNAGLQAIKDEAVRVVNRMPKWQPGTCQREIYLPVIFRLQ